MSEELVRQLIARWKEDSGGTYSTWFLWEERLKNFRSIRRGIGQVAREIADRRFGNAYRGSSLETVVGSIAEQRQIFRGADHAFLWKPKLRIPDIYESEGNQLAFGHLLHACNCCDDEDGVVAAIQRIDRMSIKGLGPAVANLLYFIHPTIVPPSNTAIVKGYNALTGARVKLGRWDHYLAMRKGILEINESHRALLSNDLGAVAGLLFDIGTGRYQAPPGAEDDAARAAWSADLVEVREESAASGRLRAREIEGDRTHTHHVDLFRDRSPSRPGPRRRGGARSGAFSRGAGCASGRCPPAAHATGVPARERAGHSIRSLWRARKATAGHCPIRLRAQTSPGDFEGLALRAPYHRLRRPQRKTPRVASGCRMPCTECGAKHS